MQQLQRPTRIRWVAQLQCGSKREAPVHVSLASCLQDRVARFKDHFANRREVPGLVGAAAKVSSTAYTAASVALAAGAAFIGFQGASKAPIEGAPALTIRSHLCRLFQCVTSCLSCLGVTARVVGCLQRPG